MDFEDLIKPATNIEVEDTTIEVLTQLQVPVQNWNPLSLSMLWLKTQARNIAVWTAVVADIARSPFLGYARGGWLTFLASNNFEVDRYTSTQASGVMQLTNTLPNVRSFPSGSLVFANPLTGQTYRSTEDYESAGNDVVSVNASAEAFGAQTTSQAGQITQLVSTVPGVNVTNLLAFVGVDEEADAALTSRTRASNAALSPNGPKDAYRYVLTSPELNPTSTPITRVTVRNNPLTGHVTVYCATAAGAPSAPDLAICVQSIVSRVEPQGIIADVFAAVAFTVNIAVTVTVESETLTNDQVQSALTAAAGAYINSVPIGGKVIPPSLTGRLDVSMLQARMIAALPSIIDLQITSPAADISASANQVFQLGTLTANVVRA